ncbi:MAG: response regulator transcription factor [Phycisphaerales bacterium]|nr:response regulator transcription factor [Phycisphaerales bacterium]MCB9862270.1 response regulator transcription factor [Phycisphaerales bacterium]
MSPSNSSPTQLGNRLSRSLLQQDQWRTIVADLRLSPREEEIVKYIFDGLKETAIARALDISPHTVHTHLERLYHKIHVQSRCEVALRVFQTFLDHVDGEFN